MQNLVQIQQRLSEIESRGFQHVGLSGAPAAKLAKMVQRKGISYPILVDPDAAVMKAFATYNRYAPLHGHPIPHPSMAVIDREGLVVHVGLKKSVIGRISVDDILQFLS